jgi:dTDP-4-amino-4,6-dideoxygalactose transaminase
MIPFLDLKAATDELAPALDAAWARVRDSAWFILGKEVEAFEQEYAAAMGARHCIGVADGLDALFLVLKAWGLKAGDEVIVPSNTYVATWLAVSQTGATPVPVEPDPSTFNLDPGRVEAAITPRTKALLPVHLYGRAAELGPLVAIAKQHGLKLLSDGAQAHGAHYQGKPVSAWGDATSWSFYPGKNLGALGDGGAITTDDDALATQLRSLRNYGSRVKYVNDVQGYNSRLDELQAAFLRAKLPLLAEWNTRRARVAARYAEGLAGLPLQLPSNPGGGQHVWHLYVVRTDRREALQAHLTASGVQTLIHYPIPPHRQLAYAAMGIAEGSLPLSEAMHREVLSLPMGPQLTPGQQAQVIAAILSFFD